MMYGYNMMNWGGLGWLFTILLWGLIIFGTVELVRYIVRSERGSSSGKDKTPIDILNERYAKGEINKEEFEEKKKDLSERK
jgi:putative membrane protein